MHIKNAEYVKMWRKTESGQLSTKSAQARCIKKKVREELLVIVDEIEKLKKSYTEKKCQHAIENALSIIQKNICCPQ